MTSDVPLSTASIDRPPAWSQFDNSWYVARYPESKISCKISGDSLPDFFAHQGSRLGHSPNMVFDERFYRATYPDIAALISGAKLASGFQHFGSTGRGDRNPHPLFNVHLYLSRSPELTPDFLAAERCHDLYDHYLTVGQFQNRIAHPLFDPVFYRIAALEAGCDPAELNRLGPFTHYLTRLHHGATELATTPYFDPIWYRARYPDAAAQIAAGAYLGALDHYLRHDHSGAFDPRPEFSEHYYLDTYPDVADAVANAAFRSGYAHFLLHGAEEARRPRADIDLAYYQSAHPSVAAALADAAHPHAYAYLCTTGRTESLAHAPPPPEPEILEPATRLLFQRQAAAALPLFARHRLDFTAKSAPSVAIVMILFNKFDLTLQALASLRDNFPADIQLIIIDNASTDQTARLERFVTGATIIHSPENLGFLRACNLALEHVTAPALLYLNNDITLGHAALFRALARLASAPDIGAVGGKIMRTHARLQEAGSIIWDDGRTDGYLRDASPLAPEANFVRDVDYCSGVFLLCRTELVRRLGGFDPAFAPAYYEEADLCVRMHNLGYRIVYDPSVVIQHLEFGSAAGSEASMELMRRGRRKFRAKHADYLATKHPQSLANQILARTPSRAKRILYLEDTVPVRRLGSGFVRANDVACAIAAAGYALTILPINGTSLDIISLLSDLPDTVEILYDRTINDLATLLAERPNFFDLIWVSRTHNLDRTLPIFQAAGLDPARTPIILDTEAIEALRLQAASTLNTPDSPPPDSPPFDLAAALAREFTNASLCTHITAVNQAEVSRLNSLGLHQCSVLGTIREPAPTPRHFTARDGLLFIASIHQIDSPNYDSLHWYVTEILPRLITRLIDPPKLTVIGYTAPGIDLTPFASRHVVLRGAVDDTTDAYNTHRLFIAPTRYAAGTPYKIYETAALGLPAIATSLLRDQLGWTETIELTTAPINDPDAFAAAIALLYQSESRWTAQREAALRRLEAENSPAPFNNTVQSILAHSFAPQSRRANLQLVS
ncbi:MAG TPA: glycosyltransferase [Acidiphilium sp.]|nr:glycosyltransferase [Acidiphilium sp.]HQU25070.1 glycosyltransferase [Acidiphilium sp.]